MSIQTMYSAQTLMEQIYEFDDSESFYPTANIKTEPNTDGYCMEKPTGATYIDISQTNYNVQPFLLANIKQDKTDITECLSYDNLLSWTTKHPEHWTNAEVLDWLYYLVDTHKLDGAHLRGENYQNLSGQKLCQMTKEDFMTTDSQFGALLYELFGQVIEQAKFMEPPCSDFVNPDSYPFFDDVCNPHGSEKPIDSNASGNYLDAHDLSVFFDEQGDKCVEIGGHRYDIGSKFEITDVMECDYYTEGSEMEYYRTSTSSDGFNSSDDDDVISPSLSFKMPPTPKRRVSSSSSDEGFYDTTRSPVDKINKRKTPPSKGNHLWEFVRDLLRDPKLNPSLLKWEDKENGVFKFVQSEAVASMWGRKKNNPGMTYEKLSRAMRFCRSAGYFSEVPKNGRFPKKLCFRFGPKAYGWKD